MTTDRLTDDEYWDSGYASHGTPAPLRVDDFRQMGDRRIVETIESIGLTGRKVLEVGAGNSAVLSYLARKHGSAAVFSGLDYSESGCRMLADRARREGAEVRVLQQDLFEPPPALLGQFDIVYSIGVAEHFTRLVTVLLAMRRLLAPGGRMMTLIPNMAGILGPLTRRYNPRVYEIHVPHDLRSFVQGHHEAGLSIDSAGYLCSTNFGVLRSCFRGPSDRGWTTYLWLSRLTKALWFVEAKLGDFPHTATLSPYLFAISRAD